MSDTPPETDGSQGDDFIAAQRCFGGDASSMHPLSQQRGYADAKKPDGGVAKRKVPYAESDP